MQTNNKLREACANIAAYARSAQCHATDAHILGYLSQIEMWACAALAEPVRNCDVGTARGQVKRWRRFCNSMTTCGECPCHKSYSEVVADCFSRWAQMPYEEGGVK